MKVFKLGLWSFKVALDRVERDFKKDNGIWSGAVSYAEPSSFGENVIWKTKQRPVFLNIIRIAQKRVGLALQ